MWIWFFRVGVDAFRMPPMSRSLRTHWPCSNRRTWKYATGRGVGGTASVNSMIYTCRAQGETNHTSCCGHGMQPPTHQILASSPPPQPPQILCVGLRSSTEAGIHFGVRGIWLASQRGAERLPEPRGRSFFESGRLLSRGSFLFFWLLVAFWLVLCFLMTAGCLLGRSNNQGCMKCERFAAINAFRLDCWP